MGLNKRVVIQGVANHNDLLGRSDADAHPQSSITGLETALANVSSQASTANTNANTANTNATNALTTAGTANTNANTALTNIGSLPALLTTNKSAVVPALNELFTNANNGKTLVASAIVGKAGTANESMTFAELSDAISAIPNISEAVGDAVAGDVLAPKTFSNGTANGLTGTLTLTGDAVANDLRLGKSMYNTDAKTKVIGTLDLSNLVPSNIKEGVTIDGKTGTLKTEFQTVGNIEIYKDGQLRTVQSPTYAKFSGTSLKVSYAGVYRIKFSLFPNTDGQTVRGKIYINDLPRGIERLNSASVDTYFTEDLSLNAGDIISLYGYQPSNGQARSAGITIMNGAQPMVQVI